MMTNKDTRSGPANDLSVADFASEWLDAWCKADVNSLARFFHEDAEFVSGAISPDSGRNILRGKEEIVSHLEQSVEFVPGPGFQILNVISSGEYFIIDYYDDAGNTASENLRISDGYVIHRTVEIDDNSETERTTPQLDTRSRGSKGGMLARVLAELFLTFGVLVLLFLVWQYTGSNSAADQGQREAVHSFTAGLVAPSATNTNEKENYGEPPLSNPPAQGTVFGVVYIPRLGADYARPLVEGTAPEQLDTLGLGHYAGTAMPGTAGNFAIAGHRQTHGAVLDNIDLLVAGDKIYVQTKDGYFTYVYRSSELVTPDQADVLLPVPHRPDSRPTERLLTLTTCNPRYGDWQRYIGYATMSSWRPLSAGPPTEISAAVDHAKKGS